MLYELDKREEWTDPTAWIKANPGLGTIKQYTTLADFVERAKKNPEDLPGVLCKDFNVKATGAASWLSYEDAVNEATFKPEEVYNTYASLKTELIYINEFRSPRELRQSIRSYINDYNTLRPHALRQGNLLPQAARFREP